MTEIRHLEIGESLRLAYRHRAGKGPTIVFLPGYMSDMEGGKAVALDDWAECAGRAFIRFDYAGCGASDGDFETQSLLNWRNDVLAIVEEVADGPVGAGRIVDGRLADAARRAGPAGAGQGPGRHRRRARFHRLGL